MPIKRQHRLAQYQIYRQRLQTRRFLPYEQYVLDLVGQNGGFWHPMRNTSGAISTNAAYRGGVGPQLFANSGVINGVGTPFTFTGDNPDSWDGIADVGDDPEISEVAAGEGHADSPTPGGGHVNIYSGAGAGAIGMSQNVQTIGDTFRKVLAVDRVVSGSVVFAAGGSGGANILPVISTPGVHTHDHIATTVALGLKRGGANTDVTIPGYKSYRIGQRDGLIAGTTTLGQTGRRGPNEAFLFDGSTSIITVTNVAALQGLTEFTLWMLFRPTSAGEASVGYMFYKGSELALRFNSVSRDLFTSVNYSGTHAQRVTSTTLSVNEWHTVGMRINDTTKTPEVFVDGLEASYASTTAGDGTRSSSASNIVIGNHENTAATLAGLVDEALLVNRALTAGEFALLHTFATGMPPGVAA